MLFRSRMMAKSSMAVERKYVCRMENAVVNHGIEADMGPQLIRHIGIVH